MNWQKGYDAFWKIMIKDKWHKDFKWYRNGDIITESRINNSFIYTLKEIEKLRRRLDELER